MSDTRKPLWPDDGEPFTPTTKEPEAPDPQRDALDAMTFCAMVVFIAAVLTFVARISA